ncbi:FAD-binding oxidoreductase [Isosphaeraceae bacterium EP7]
MIWPESPAAGPLGDSRLAIAHERPESVEALSQFVGRHAADGTAIYPQGGRTSLDYGGLPSRPGVIIDTTGLNRVIDYPHADMTITVEAGLTLSAIAGVLDEHGQRLNVDAPQGDRATIGGIFACNATGPKRLGWGRPRDQIIGISYVSAAGEPVKGGGRVVKNVAGYDLPKLLTGSMGTLGIISQLTLKVRPKPEACALAWRPIDDPAEIERRLASLNMSGTRPVALELLNRAAARRVGGPVGLPEAAWVLVVGFEDNKASVDWQVDRLQSELDGCLSVLRDQESAPLWSALAEFPAAEPGPLSFLANVVPSAVAGLAGSLDPEAWELGAHAGSGILRGHALGDIERADAAIPALRAEAARGKGSVVLTRCPADRKEALKVWGDPRPDWHLTERIKKALDPAGIMNPGRFLGTI